MVSFFAVDSMILQWGIFGTLFPGTDETQVRNVTGWIRECQTRKDRFGLSSIVIGQTLVAQPVVLHEALTNALQKVFMIYSYNDAAARRFASIFRDHLDRNKEILRQIKQETGRPSQAIKIDMMILAHAITMGADAFYTCNVDDFQLLAPDLIPVRYPMPQQPALFDEDGL